MSAPLTFGRHGFLTAGEVAALLRYASPGHFLRIRDQLEREGFPPPIRRGRRLLWPAEGIEVWREAQRASVGLIDGPQS